MLPVEDLVEVGGPLGGHQLHLDADAAEVGLQGLGDLLRLRHVRPRRQGHPQLGGEPAGQSRLGEQLPGALRVVLVGGHIVVVAPHDRRYRVLGGHRQAGVEVVHQGLLVHRVVDGAADPQVAEGLLVEVHRQVAHVHPGLGEELDLRVGADALDELRVEVVDAVDVAGAQLEEAHRGVLDVLEDEAVDPRSLAPVAVEVLEDDALVLAPLDETEGTGAHRVLEVVGAVALHRRRRDDAAEVHAQGRQEGGAGGGQLHDEGRVVGGGHVGDDVVHAHVLPVLVVAGGGPVPGMVGEELAAEGVQNRLGGEGRAVVEAHVGAQVEGPAQAVVADLPAAGQLGEDLGRPGLVGDQVLVEVVADLEGLAVVLQGRVETDGVGAPSEDQHPLRLGGGAAAAGGQKQQGAESGGQARGGHGDYSEKAASKAASEGSKSTSLTKAQASAAPCSRSMPPSSHSTERGPS